EVINADVAKVTLALCIAVGGFYLCTIVDAHLTLRDIDSAGTNPELNIRFVKMLAKEVIKTVKLVAKLEIVRTHPTALVPSKVCIDLNCLVGILRCESCAIGRANESLSLL